MNVTWETRHKVFAAFEITGSAVSVVANGLVVMVFYKNPSLRSGSNLYMFFLAVADMLVSCIVAPTSVTSFMGIPRHLYGCIFINCLAVVFTNNSTLTLLVVTFERWLAVTYPVTHRKIFTHNKAVCIVVVTWIIGSLIGFIPLMGWHIGDTNLKHCDFTNVIPRLYIVSVFFGVQLPCFMFMLFVYARMFFVFKGWHRSKLRRMTISSHLCRMARESLSESVSEANTQMIRRVSMLAALCTVFAICWLPLHIANSVSLFASIGLPEKVVMALVFLSHANSAVNPFLYAFFSSTIRKAVLEMIQINHPRLNRAASTLISSMTVRMSELNQAVREMCFLPTRSSEPEGEITMYSVKNTLITLVSNKDNNIIVAESGSTTHIQEDKQEPMKDGNDGVTKI